jgi:hypothetical protein
MSQQEAHGPRNFCPDKAKERLSRERRLSKLLQKKKKKAHKHHGSDEGDSSRRSCG